MDTISSNYIADTNILIAYFAGKLVDEMPPLLGISVISEIELFAFPNLSKTDEQQLKIALTNINCFTLSDDIKAQTIRLKQAYKIKIPDAIICATAIVNDAVLLTNDKQLLNLTALKALPLK